VLAFAMIWAGYQFRFAAAPDARAGLTFDPSWETLLEANAGPTAAASPSQSLIGSGIKTRMPAAIAGTVSWLREHRVLPEAYLWSVAFTFQASRTRPSFFWGESSEAGSRWFFPGAFLLKTTPPELLLFAAGVLAAGWKSLSRPSHSNRVRARLRLLYRSAPLLVLFILYGAVALNTPLNIGHRHLLPIYPVLFIFAGAAALWLQSKRHLPVASLLGAMAVWQGWESRSIRPFYLSYFTPFVGDRGWHYLVDSSFDWGQGLPALQRWIEARQANGDRTPIFLSYFGSDSPRARALPVTRVADWRDDSGARNYPAPLRGGWYAISATNFQRVYLGIAGSWSPLHEQRYQDIGRALPPDAASAARLTEAQREEWMRNAMLFEILQFGRVCHFLRDRPPDEIVGASILIFRLTDEEVSRALASPLADASRSLSAR